AASTPRPTAPAPATKRRRLIREFNLDIRLPPFLRPIGGPIDCSQTFPSAIVGAYRPEERSYTNDPAILHQPPGESTFLRCSSQFKSSLRQGRAPAPPTLDLLVRTVRYASSFQDAC